MLGEKFRGPSASAATHGGGGSSNSGGGDHNVSRPKSPLGFKLPVNFSDTGGAGGGGSGGGGGGLSPHKPRRPPLEKAVSDKAGGLAGGRFRSKTPDWRGGSMKGGGVGACVGGGADPDHLAHPPDFRERESAGQGQGGGGGTGGGLSPNRMRLAPDSSSPSVASSSSPSHASRTPSSAAAAAAAILGGSSRGIQRASSLPSAALEALRRRSSSVGRSSKLKQQQQQQQQQGRGEHTEAQQRHAQGGEEEREGEREKRDEEAEQEAAAAAAAAEASGMDPAEREAKLQKLIGQFRETLAGASVASLSELRVQADTDSPQLHPRPPPGPSRNLRPSTSGGSLAANLGPDTAVGSGTPPWGARVLKRTTSGVDGGDLNPRSVALGSAVERGSTGGSIDMDARRASLRRSASSAGSRSLLERPKPPSSSLLFDDPMMLDFLKSQEEEAGGKQGSSMGAAAAAAVAKADSASGGGTDSPGDRGKGSGQEETAIRPSILDLMAEAESSFGANLAKHQHGSLISPGAHTIRSGSPPSNDSSPARQRLLLPQLSDDLGAASPPGASGSPSSSLPTPPLGALPPAAVGRAGNLTPTTPPCSSPGSPPVRNPHRPPRPPGAAGGVAGRPSHLQKAGGARRALGGVGDETGRGLTGGEGTEEEALKSLVLQITALGGAAKCKETYKAVRRMVLGREVTQLAVEEVGHDELESMTWEDGLEPHMNKWLYAARHLILTLYPDEKQLCKVVLGDKELGPGRMLSQVLASAGAMDVLPVLARNAAHIAHSSPLPERLFSLLDMFTATSPSPSGSPDSESLAPMVQEMCRLAGGRQLAEEWAALPRSLAGAVFATMDDLLRVLQAGVKVGSGGAHGLGGQLQNMLLGRKRQLSGKFWLHFMGKKKHKEEGGGYSAVGVHSLNSYVVNYIKQWLDQDGSHRDAMQAVYLSMAVTDSSSTSSGGGGNSSSSNVGGPRNMDADASKILEVLEKNMETKARKMFKNIPPNASGGAAGAAAAAAAAGPGTAGTGGEPDPMEDAIAKCLFLINNVEYINNFATQADLVSASSFATRLESHISNFLSTALAKNIATLGAVEESKNLPPEEVGLRLRRFNKAFEQLAMQQGQWAVVSPDCRKVVRTRMAQTIKDAYRDFLTPHREDLGTIPNYLWTPDGIERVMLKSFFLTRVPPPPSA